MEMSNKNNQREKSLETVPLSMEVSMYCAVYVHGTKAMSESYQDNAVNKASQFSGSPWRLVLSHLCTHRTLKGFFTVNVLITVSNTEHIL